MDAPMRAPVFAPTTAPTAAPRTSPVTAAPRTAPETAPQPAPCPVAVSQEESANEASNNAEPINRFFFFITCARKLFEKRSDGKSAPRIQANAHELRCDPATLLEASQAVFFFKNTEAIHFHSPQEGLIDRPHDLRRHHRAAIFPREQFRGLREEFPGPRGFKFHQTEERFIVFPETEIFLRIAETGEILLRQINSSVAQVFSDIADDVGHLERQAELDRVSGAGRIAVPENLDADQPDGARDAVAIHPQFLKGVVADRTQIHPTA